MTKLNTVCMPVAAALLAAAPAIAQQVPGPYYGRHMTDGPWHGWFFGPLMMILFIAVAVVVVVLVIRWIGGSGGATPAAPPGTGRSALDILRERYARGEIDTAEFEERRRALNE